MYYVTYTFYLYILNNMQRKSQLLYFTFNFNSDSNLK